MFFSRRNKKQDQAKLITAWIEKDEGENNRAWICISNDSVKPVMDIILTIVKAGTAIPSGKGIATNFRSCLSIVLPGKFYSPVETHHGMGFRAGIECCFRDADGNSWVRSAGGKLFFIDKSPAAYYELPLPISWEMPLNKIQ